MHLPRNARRTIKAKGDRKSNRQCCFLIFVINDPQCIVFVAAVDQSIGRSFLNHSIENHRLAKAKISLFFGIIFILQYYFFLSSLPVVYPIISIHLKIYTHIRNAFKMHSTEKGSLFV